MHSSGNKSGASPSFGDPGSATPGSLSSFKNGSDGGFNWNDGINGAINLGGNFAPPGASFGAGLAKSFLQGHDVANTNGMTTAQSLLYGPSMGERAGNWLQQLFHTDAGSATQPNNPATTQVTASAPTAGPGGFPPMSNASMGIAQTGMGNAVGTSNPSIPSNGDMGQTGGAPSWFSSIFGSGSMPSTVSGGTTGSQGQYSDMNGMMGNLQLLGNAQAAGKS